MNSTAITFVGSGIVSIASFFAGVGIWGTAENIINDPDPHGAQLVRLDFQQGQFIQRVKPINIYSLRMKWAAKITRNGEILCSGGGISSYTDKTVTMTPEIWTDDDCPALQVGDVADASWTYETVDGYNVTINGKKKLDRL